MNAALALVPGAAPIERPSLALLGLEPWRAAVEFVSHKLARSTPATAGDGDPVIIFPGMGTDGTAVAPLRRHCESPGHAAADWGLGYNTGPQGNVDRWLKDLAAHTASMLTPFEQSATLVGWSLGGLYARELAKQLWPQVRQVITIGTPFNRGHRDQTQPHRHGLEPGGAAHRRRPARAGAGPLACVPNGR